MVGKYFGEEVERTFEGKNNCLGSRNRLSPPFLTPPSPRSASKSRPCSRLGQVNTYLELTIYPVIYLLWCSQSCSIKQIARGFELHVITLSV